MRRQRPKKGRVVLDPLEKLRKQLRAMRDDAIDHLLVDVPPCAPYEEPEIKKGPLSDTAAAIKQAVGLVDGALLLDMSERNAAALVELGGAVELCSDQPARVHLCVCWRPDPDRWNQAIAHSWDVHYVESRQDAERNARLHPHAYTGWNEPPPPELTAEQAVAFAAEAAFQAKEFAMVAAAERELAAVAAAKAFPIRSKEAA